MRHGHWADRFGWDICSQQIAAEVTDLIQNFPDIYALQLEEGMREIGNTLSGV